MDKAIVVFRRKGLFKTPIKASNIRSREQARKLWPLVAPDGARRMVTWVPERRPLDAYPGGLSFQPLLNF